MNEQGMSLLASYFLSSMLGLFSKIAVSIWKVLRLRQNVASHNVYVT